MDVSECRDLAGTARVARLATLDADGRANLVPFVFAVKDDTILGVVDRKPKRTTNLARLANIRRDERVTVLFDHYEEDWNKLWWVRTRGRARVLDDPDEVREVIQELRAKYQQYNMTEIEDIGIAIAVDEWRAWRAD